jgi:DNA invertase Pin-like site-specific DNA recombinase
MAVYGYARVSTDGQSLSTLPSFSHNPVLANHDGAGTPVVTITRNPQETA